MLAVHSITVTAWVTLVGAAAVAAPGPQDAAEPIPRPVWLEPGATFQGMPSPDGRFLSCVDPATGDLAIRDLRSGTMRRLTGERSRRFVADSGTGAGSRDASAPRYRQFAYFSAVSPDSRRIAYAWMNEAGFYELRVIGTDGSAERVLYRNEEAGFVQPSGWTPDGRHILTLLFRKDNTSQIALVPVVGGALRVLKSLQWVYPKKMDISPDGRWIVYDSFAVGGSGSEAASAGASGRQATHRDIFILAADGTQERLLIGGPSEEGFPLWAHGGKSIVFASDRNGVADLWMVPVADGVAVPGLRRLKRGIGRFVPMGIAGGGAASGAASAAGTTSGGTLYFGRRAGASDIYIAPAAGGAPEKLPSRYAGANSFPAFSHDGEQLAYFTRVGTENFGAEARVLTIRSLLTGAERQFTPKLALMEHVRWSPDGTKLLIAGSDGQGRAGSFLVQAQTGAMRPVTTESHASRAGFPGDWLDPARVVLGGPYLRELAIGSATPRSVGMAPVASISVRGGRIAYVSEGRVYVTGERAAPGGNAVHRAQRPGTAAGADAARAASSPGSGGQAGRLVEELAGRVHATMVEWVGERLLVGDGERLLLDGRALELPGWDGGPVSAQGGRIAYSGGTHRNEIWAIEIP